MCGDHLVIERFGLVHVLHVVLRHGDFCGELPDQETSGLQIRPRRQHASAVFMLCDALARGYILVEMNLRVAVVNDNSALHSIRDPLKRRAGTIGFIQREFSGECILGMDSWEP